MSRLLQLTDLHVVAPGERASGVLDTPALLRAAIDRLLDRLDRIGPIDAVLLTGDISDDGCDASYAFARAELDRLGLPLLAVPGNHDRRAGLRAAFPPPAEAPPKAGVSTGDDGDALVDWAVEIGDDLIVGLDTLVEGQGGGRLRPSSLEHLARAIAEFDGRSIVVALHHPPLRTGIRFMDRIGLADADELADAIRAVDVPLRVVAGHVHGVYHGSVGGHPVSTAPSTCSAFALDTRENAPAGFLDGPRGCAVIDTTPPGVWSAMMLDDAADRPHPFRSGG